jgi:hypothetical protein
MLKVKGIEVNRLIAYYSNTVAKRSNDKLSPLCKQISQIPNIKLIWLIGMQW